MSLLLCGALYPSQEKSANLKYRQDVDKVDMPFRMLKFLHFSCSFMDYQTTLHAGRLPRFQEQNKITALYWRTPPAFCAFKSVEVIVQNWVFDRLYKWSKPVAYITVIAFAVVRIVAFRNNVKVMGVR